jgi:hypothetical protein
MSQARPVDAGYDLGDAQMRYRPCLVCYRVVRRTTGFFLLSKSIYSFISDEHDLYYSVISSKSQKDPIPIFRQTTPPESPPDFQMVHSDDYRSFSVKLQGIDLFTVTMQPEQGRRSPKKIEAKWFNDDGTIQQTFSSRSPTRNSQGDWVLDFEERTVEPSTQNCIMTDPETQDALFMVRKVDSVETNMDANPRLPTLFLFFFILAVKICPF